MKKYFIILLIAFVSFTNAFAQTANKPNELTPAQRVCGTMQYHEYLKQNRKGYEVERAAYNQMIEQYMQTPQFNAMKTTANITIPVVIHIVYKTAAENITDAQAMSQFAVLDNDFNHLNADTVNTPLAFRSVAGKTGIRFCLAQRDPNGNATTGIEHIATATASFATNNTVKSTATGGANAWDVTKYVNIWICNLGTTILGYGEFPTGSISTTYGLVLHYKYTGAGGSSVAPFNKGRTGTHEFGHCFNLNHIWGDNGQCGATDNCPDTPPQRGQATNAPFGCNYGTPTYPLNANTCTRPDGVAGANVTNTNGDMFMNYMDYTDDAAMNIFTKDQCARMLAVVSTSPWNVLQSSLGCTAVSALDAGLTSIISPFNGYSSCNNVVTPKVTLNNAGSTTLTSATINYKLDAAATQTLSWVGSLANPNSTLVTLPAITGVSIGAHTFSVWVTAPNGGVDANATNNSQTSSFTIVGTPTAIGLPLVEQFEAVTFPPTGWVKLTASTINTVNTWSRLANTTGLTVGSTAIAKMDNFSGAVDVTGQKDALRTPALTFTAANTSLNLTFDVSHKMYSTPNADTLSVFISSDCGGTWTQLYTKGGATLSSSAGTQTATAFTPTANAQWRKETVSLASYVGLSNVYLDNINISFITSVTPPVANFSTSVSSVCANTNSVALTDLSTNTPTTWTWTANPSAGAVFTSTTTQNSSISFTNAGTYSITLTAANSGGASSVTKTISVVASPTLASSNQTICSGASATLTASGASSYTWAPGSLTGATVVVTPTTTTSYTLNGSNGVCTIAKTVTVTVINNPTITVNSATLCAGASAVLTATGATTYSWNTTATTATISVNPTSLTVYTVTGTTLGCSTTKTTSVFVNQLPIISAFNTGTVSCVIPTISVIASGTTAATYSWTGAGILSGANTATAVVNQAGNYVVTATSAAGCTYSNVTTVTSNVSLPNISLVPSTSTICVGASANITGSSTTTPVSYSWSNGAITASITTSPTLTTVYTLTVTNLSNGCINTASTTINVNALPNVLVTSATLCAGTSTLLTASGATTYSWNTAAITATISVNPTSLTIYTVTGTTLGCSTTKTTSVFVNTTPTVSAGANVTLTCVSPTTTLNGNGSATSYTWSGAGIVSGGNTPTATVGSAGVYTLVGTANGCSSNSSTVTVSNSVGVPSITITPTSTICLGSTIILNVNAATTNTVLWSNALTTNSISVSPTVTTNYSVVVTNTLNGCQTSGNVLVNVVTPPTANAGITKTITCTNATATLTGTGVTSYSWSGVGIISGSNTANPIVNAAGTYSLVGYTGTCASNMATVIVTSNTTVPTLTLSASSSSICLGSTTNLFANSGTSTISYSWSPIGASSQSIVITPTVTTNYGVVVTNTINGCAITRTIQINVANAPALTASSASICNGSVGTCTVGGAVTYTWMPGSLTGSSISLSPSTTTIYTVTGASALGCTNTATSYIFVTNGPTVAVSNTTACAGNAVNLIATGATTYSWNTGATTATLIVTPTTTTVYTVTGYVGTCANSKTLSVTVNSSPTVAVANVINASCFGICNGEFTTNATGGTAPYSYSVIPNGASTNLCAGNYTVFVIDANGCNASTTTVITEPTPLTVTTTYTDASCGTCADGSANSIVSGGNASYTYTWSTGEIATNITNLLPTCYTVYVSDLNNCQASATTCVGFGTKITELVNDNTVAIYPNPTSTNFNVNVDETYFNNGSIEIFDAIGKLIIKQIITTTVSNVSLQAFAEGVYTVKIISENHNPRVIKLLKN